MGAKILRILSAGVLLLGVTAAEAQYAASIRGVVHDHEGRPMPGAVVTLSHPTSPAVRVAVTDLRGEYAIRGLEPDTAYVVHVTYPGFRKQKLQTRAYAAVQGPTIVRLTPRRTTLIAAR
jgi:protocatechuate 3,4-dioxygenase beta subunit